MNKIYSIEFLRFLFMVIICLWHFRGVVPACGHGYLAVEFYFILSGYLLYKSYKGGRYTDALDYTLKKIKRFYVPVLLALVPALIVRWRSWITSNIISDCNRLLTEVLMLRRSPMFEDSGANGPVWYVTILLLAGFVLFHLLKKEARFMVFLITTVGYGWLLSSFSSLDDLLVSDHHGLLLLLRGLAGLSLGALIAMANNRVELPQYCSKALDILSVYCLVAFTYMCFTYGTVSDGEGILLASILVMQSFRRSSILNKLFTHRHLAKLGNLSLYMLLTHFTICQAIQHHILKFLGITPPMQILSCWLLVT